MKSNGILVLLIGFLVGAALELATSAQDAANQDTIYDVVETHQLSVFDGQIFLGMGKENGPGLWISPPPKPSVQFALHGNGFPMVIVSDGPVQNFGLSRVDGKNATPIMVFRSADVVKMVLGLDMVNPGKEPFLVHYSADGKKNLLIGDYCDNPSRVCTK